jgi:hypothetical protein
MHLIGADASSMIGNSFPYKFATIAFVIGVVSGGVVIAVVAVVGKVLVGCCVVAKAGRFAIGFGKHKSKSNSRVSNLVC